MQSNKNFYEGQNIYIGLDVHAKQWHVYSALKDSIGAVSTTNCRTGFYNHNLMIIK